MSGVDQRLEIVGTAIRRIRRVRQDAVVAPVAVAGKVSALRSSSRSIAPRNVPASVKAPTCSS
jgi:hypothetical protein